MNTRHWLCLAAGMAIGYLVLPTVIGAVRSRLG